MRIGFDAKRAFLNRSGLGNYSRDLIRSLHQQYPEDDYFLFTPGLKDSLPVVKGKTVSISTAPASWGKFRQAWWRSYKIAKEVREKKLDIFHGLSNELPKNIQNSGVKSVVTIHDLIFMRYPQWYKPIDRAIYRKKFSYASRIADRVVTVSQQTKEDLITFFGIDKKKIRVIYQGCNQAFKTQLNEDQKRDVKKKWQLPDEYLLYVGTVEERKNILTLIKAIHNQDIKIPLVVVGRPTSYMKKVRDYIRLNKIQNIIFLKEVMVDDLPGIYQAAKIFIYPSLFEGFGIPILEALISGIPVITSEGGCFSEVGGESTIYIDPLNADDLGRAVVKLLGNDSLQKKMIRDGLRHAEQFSNETVATQIRDLYKELLHG